MATKAKGAAKAAGKAAAKAAGKAAAGKAPNSAPRGVSVSLSESNIEEAVGAVCGADPRIAALRAEYGEPVGLIRKRKAETCFQALVRSVTSQQLAIKAAAAIHARLVDLAGGDVTPESILRFDVDEMKTVGLSTSKANYIQVRIGSAGGRAAPPTGELH